MDLQLWRKYRQYRDQSGRQHAVNTWAVAYGGVPFSTLCRHNEAMKPAGELTQQNACPGCHKEILRLQPPKAPVADGRQIDKSITTPVKTGDYL